MTKMFPVVVALLTAGCATSQDRAIERMFAFESPKQLSSKAQAEVAKHPLGSEANPVRAEGPPGQRSYLQRLRCPEGKPPTFERQGSAGLSPYGSIMDIYEAACDSPPAKRIYIDMYHSGYIESDAVPGFTIVVPSAT
jgi:hypothetical protein